ncbi:hypothetical protein HDU77_007558 [Chytriomyces hyalinus]|nr:hypothetical protein HDU77_007558 [Chytriomyces hyalinus]
MFTGPVQRFAALAHVPTTAPPNSLFQKLYHNNSCDYWAQTQLFSKSRLGGVITIQVLPGVQPHGGKTTGSFKDAFSHFCRPGNLDKQVHPYKKEKTLSHGQKLAAASKRAKAPKST